MIKIKSGYADLCIPYNNNFDDMMEILNELIEVGYRNVAIEQIYNHETISSKNDAIPLPVSLDKLTEKTQGKLNLYNRLTIIYNDNSISHTMSRSHIIRKYQIIAALPTTDAALQHACQTFVGDIITYNSDTIKFRLNRKFYYLALRRNMFFELKYSPAIMDSLNRRSTIARSYQYHLAGRSRGIIISSEATDRFQVRSPCDIANLGLIFNLSEDQAKSSVNSMCSKVLVAAESRRLGRTPVLLKYEDVDTTTTEEEDDESETEVDQSQSKKRKDSTVESFSLRNLLKSSV